MSKKSQKSLREEIDRIEREEIDKERSYVRGTPPADPGQVYSIRIPVSLIETVRELAAAKRIKPSAMLRNWIVDRLNAEARAGQDVLRVANHSVSGYGQDIDRMDLSAPPPDMRLAPIYVSFLHDETLSAETAETLREFRLAKRISEQLAVMG